jgi:hypothetical protein
MNADDYAHHICVHLRLKQKQPCERSAFVFFKNKKALFSGRFQTILLQDARQY